MFIVLNELHSHCRILLGGWEKLHSPSSFFFGCSTERKLNEYINIERKVLTVLDNSVKKTNDKNNNLTFGWRNYTRHVEEILIKVLGI